MASSISIGGGLTFSLLELDKTAEATSLGCDSTTWVRTATFGSIVVAGRASLVTEVETSFVFDEDDEAEVAFLEDLDFGSSFDEGLAAVDFIMTEITSGLSLVAVPVSDLDVFEEDAFLGEVFLAFPFDVLLAGSLAGSFVTEDVDLRVPPMVSHNGFKFQPVLKTAVENSGLTLSFIGE